MSARGLVPAESSTGQAESVALTGLVSKAERVANIGEESEEISESELLDFLAADHDPIPADPAFRDQLREELWALVEKGAFNRPPDH